MTKMRNYFLSDVLRFREMPLVPTPAEDVDQALSGFSFSHHSISIASPETSGEEMVALLPKPQEALEESERLLDFQERSDGLAA